MIRFKSLFHFLGGIQFAIILIALSALIVAIGTFLESKSDSHLAAARLTYENPVFRAVLCLFFINILFSSLRRWPFKKKHIPFLITHLGLLMVISGTMVKNVMGLQGQMIIWEGSSNSAVILPHTYALAIEEKNVAQKNLYHQIPLHKFQPNIYSPFHLPSIKCRLVGYAPHVKERFESWIKGSHAYIAGFPPIPVQEWKTSKSFPKGITYPFTLSNPMQNWSVFALRSNHFQEVLRQAYIQDLKLRIQVKANLETILEIPIQEALEKPFEFANGTCYVALHLQDEKKPYLDFKWLNAQGCTNQLSVPLQGHDALLNLSGSNWLESPFVIDLIRPQINLCLVSDEDGNTHLFAFDKYGRIHREIFSSDRMKSLVSFDQGFSGYGIQAKLPIPSFPNGRIDKEQSDADALTDILKDAFLQNPPLTPPLRLLQKACKKSGEDMAEIFVVFLKEWHLSSGILFQTHRSLPKNLEKALSNIDWKELAESDLKAILWTNLLYKQLEQSYNQGRNDLIEVLEKCHWPFVKEVKQNKDNIQPLNLLAQQMHSLVSYMPPCDIPNVFSLNDQAQFLATYFRIYNIDYMSLYPYQGDGDEQFERLVAYWRKQKNNPEELQKFVLLETPLTHQLISQSVPEKVEEQVPGIVLEVKQGQQIERLSLAYEPTSSGLKWPILNGNYLIRLQPQTKLLPHRIRLRQARQISYPETSQTYSYESDVLLYENGKDPLSVTLSMNHVHETWDGYRFYLAGVGTSSEGIKHIQLAINYDPAKYFLTYPGGLFIFLGSIMLFRSLFLPQSSPKQFTNIHNTLIHT